MKNYSKNRGTPSGQSCANSVLKGATTMSKLNNKELSKLLYFMSTFDGGLYIAKNCKNAKFIMNMRKENLDYVTWVSEVLNNITSTSITERPDYNTDGCSRKEQVRLESKTHPKLTSIQERIYLDRKKVIDPHMLTLLDAEALAIIFMADGSVVKETNANSFRVTLNTKGFTYFENVALGKAIYDKLGINCNINRQNNYYYIVIPVKSQKLFIETVLPYMKDSFMYKLERIAPYLGVGGDIV